MQINQFVHTLSYGDAISGEALAIKRLLRSMGVRSEIYSIHTHHLLKNDNRHWSHYGEDSAAAREHGEQQALVLHYSIGSPLNALFRDEHDVLRALIYHNLTPDHWFLGYNPRVVSDLRQGRTELPRLLEFVDLAIADSEFNKQELMEFGAKEACVLPLLIDRQKWETSPNPGIVRVLKSHGGKNILHVGRLAPNKCVEDIIKAFYFYHHKIEQNSKLWLVGSDIDTEIYSFELRSLITELRLKDAVEMVGTVADSELRSFYEASDVYLCMSEHEGFCVPLIEAMHFGLPVIAFNSSAVGDTLGDGGLLLKNKAPAETAELINLVVTDASLRSEMITRGKARSEIFNESRFTDQLKSLLLEPLSLMNAGANKLRVTK